MELAILGPLEVRLDGQPVPLRRGRPRVLLVSLVLRVGRVVPTEVLIDEVWGDQRLTNATNTLQVQVSYLRRALGLATTGDPPALRTAAGGYQLDVEPDSVDSHRFERLVTAAAGRLATGSSDAAARAVGELEQALGLWRGEPLQDVAYERFARAEIARLNELRAAAREYEIDARLQLGQHELVVPALRRLIAEHPLRERLRGQLVLALYRSGRQADALRELDVARAQLVEELGVDPGPDLQRLHRAVLEQQPSLEWTPPPPSEVRPIPSVIGGAGLARSSSARLPAPTTKLIGRHLEVQRIQEALVDNRMVTLSGPGGVGKSRLALAVAHEQAERGPVWLVELADVGDGRVVPFEIARAVGVVTEADPFEALTVRVGQQPGLLVLDTCEHLIDACAAAAHRLLRSCPALAVLATSRQPLTVAGEVAWPVPPLGVPAPDASLAEAGETEAVRLFCDRARAVRPTFDLDRSNAADVAAICRILDGLPLAIELAAARITVLSPAAILSRLDDRFALLRKVGRAADVRQQSLDAAIRSSYDLLDEDQRHFFERLGVFAGRFSLASADRVAADGLGTEALELLSAMIERSLVVVDGEDSFRVLESLRAFVLDRLAVPPVELDAARTRLAIWLAEFCEAWVMRAHQAGEDPVFSRVRAEVPNLRSTLEWTFSGGDPMLGVRLVCSLAWFWGAIGANEEANRWLRTALGVPDLDDVVRARLLEGVALHAFSSGDLRAGQIAADEAAGCWVASGSPESGFATLIYQGLSQRSRRELDAAATTLDRAIGIARVHYGDWALAVTLYWRAAVAADQDDDPVATTLLEQALALAEQADDRRAVGSIIHQLGRIALRSGDAVKAADLAQQALAVHEEVGWNPGIAAAHEAIGRALVAQHRPDEAMEHHRQGLRRAIEVGAPAGTAKLLEGLAGAAIAAGAPTAGAEALGAASALRTAAAVPANAIQRRAVDQIATALRAQLGAAIFEATFQRGQALEPSELLARGQSPLRS